MIADFIPCCRKNLRLKSLILNVESAHKIFLSEGQMHIIKVMMKAYTYQRYKLAHTHAWSLRSSQPVAPVSYPLGICQLLAQSAGLA